VYWTTPSGNHLITTRSDAIINLKENVSQSDLLLGTFYSVRAMADVAADSESIVTTDGTFALI
jgi:hypothetical protein